MLPQLVYYILEDVDEYFEEKLLLLVFLFIKQRRHRLANRKIRRQRPREL